MADSAGFRMELVHANSMRAGYLDMDGCTVVDLLPRYRVPGLMSSALPPGRYGAPDQRIAMMTTRN